MTTQGQVHSTTFVQDHSDSTFSNKLLFFKIHHATESKFHMEPPWDDGNENLFKSSGSYSQDVLQAHRWKNLQKSPYSEPRGRWPWTLVYSIGYSSTSNFVQTMTLGSPWPFFIVKFVRYCFCMGKSLYSIQSSISKLILIQHIRSTHVSEYSKMISNDQELIQSDPTSCPQNQKGNN